MSDSKLLPALAQLAQRKATLLTDEARLWQLLSHALADQGRKEQNKRPPFKPDATEETLDSVPTEGLMRIEQVLKLIPISKSSWWKGVKEGVYPQPIKIKDGVTAWRNSDILQLIRQFTQKRE